MPFPTPDPPRIAPQTIPRGAILGGSIGGGVILLGFSVAMTYFLRHRLRRFVHGGPEPPPEMDGRPRRVVNEIMDREVFWELDAGGKPAVLKRPCSPPRELSAESVQSANTAVDPAPRRDGPACTTEDHTSRASTPGVGSMGGSTVVSSPLGSARGDGRPKWLGRYSSMEGGYF